jgi:hypothetical protein
MATMWRGNAVTYVTLPYNTVLIRFDVCKLFHNLRGLFQNQPPIGWLKKYKRENKTLLYGRVTYITALLLHIVAIHI